MADRRSLGSAPVVKDVGLFADGAQKAVAHFSHNVICTSLLGLVPAPAEVDGSSAGQLVGLVGDVAVSATHSQGEGAYLPEFLGICAGCSGTQQFLDFVAG